MSGRVVRRGDTLIEVIFAFAILGTIIGMAFTGVIGARRSAVAAQERTQATFVAQYQSEALKNYRDSLHWNSDAGTPNFLTNPPEGTGSQAPTIGSGSFCMVQQGQLWRLVPSGSCNTADQLRGLVQAGSTNLVSIVFSSPTPTNPSVVNALITVTWQDAFGRATDVTQQVTLTSSR